MSAGTPRLCRAVLASVLAVFTIAAAVPGMAAAKNSREEIYDYYVQGLGRVADPGGFLSWTRSTAGNCQPGLAAAARGILLSQEYANRGRTNSQKVYDAYHTILMREPDSGGYNTWVSKLNSGQSWTSVVDGINGSAEATNRRSSICGSTDWAVKWVALGDSYSSGTGTREYYAGCERSYWAYPFQTPIPYGANTGVWHAACGGAKTGLESGPDANKDVWQMQLPWLDRSTGIVTMTIGGNDANFVSVVRQCAKPWPTTCWGDIDNARAFITGTLPGRYDTLYAEIKRRAPAARIVIVGYPRLFGPQECNGALSISTGEQQELNDLADTLRNVTRDAAARAGARFADPISPFIGHAICSGSNEYLNGLSDPTSESFHPNRNGHSRGYASVVGPQIG